jgi:hypothetical protein
MKKEDIVKSLKLYGVDWQLSVSIEGLAINWFIPEDVHEETVISLIADYVGELNKMFKFLGGSGLKLVKSKVNNESTPDAN